MKRPLFTGMFCARLAIVAFGALVAAPGLYAWIHGNYWFTAFNPRFGQFGTGPTVAFVFFGALIALFGIFSKGWERISRAEEKELDRKWQRSQRHKK
jgi:hypothetical protein